MYLWHDGIIKREEEIRISPLDHGFVYGMGVFETFRTYNGHPFLFDDHIERLQMSCVALGIQLAYDRKALRQAIQDLYDAHGANDLYIRLNVSAGPREIGLSIDPYDTPTVLIYAKPIAPRKRAERALETIRLPRSTPETTYRLKSHHYMNNLLAKRQLFNPEAEGLFLTKEGHVCETGALNGITRQFLMQHLPVEERLAYLPQLEEADEIIYTNSVQEAVAISALDGRPFPGINGIGYAQLMTLFDQSVEQVTTRREQR